MELLAIAGYVVFLCVFGLRGFLISTIVGIAVVAILLVPDYRASVQRKADAVALHAECIAHPPAPADEVGEFLCLPAPH